MNATKVKKELRKKANPEKAEIYKYFFKTGKGQYGEGDKFLGLYVPETRSISKRFLDLPFEEIKKLMKSKYHEDRLCGLLILVENFKKTQKIKEKNKKKTLQKKIYEFYLKNIDAVNNWDLVDLTADKIVGEYLYDKNRKKIYMLANSKNLWKRRIAIVSTFNFIKKRDFKDTLKLAKLLLKDKHDLMHKAVGWMLREIGKRDEKQLLNFLNKYSTIMPRTTLRYSLEKLTKKQKEHYMKK